MELKITKEKVLIAAAKCSTAKQTLETLFPEVFKPDAFRFEDGTVLSANISNSELPFYIGDAHAPSGLQFKCLIVKSDYEMTTQMHIGIKILTFTKKEK